MLLLRRAVLPLSTSGDVRAVDQPSSLDKSRDGWWRSMGRLPTAEPPHDAQVCVTVMARVSDGDGDDCDAPRCLLPILPLPLVLQTALSRPSHRSPLLLFLQGMPNLPKTYVVDLPKGVDHVTFFPCRIPGGLPEEVRAALDVPIKSKLHQLCALLPAMRFLRTHCSLLSLHPACP